ncbi:MAG: VCBS repeat-containing protein, partial [Planctomycetes bacterium]|nr:VCBS repeat-containing protein [Planctomycetota bacterium]
FDDVIVGSQHAYTGVVRSGSAFIFFGKSNWSSKIDAENADVELIGSIVMKSFGVIVSSAGDFNNDGYDDVIVGAIGKAYIFLGSSNPYSKIYTSNADVILIGENHGDFFGTRISNAGDFNNDGFDDVIVGSPEHNYPENAGCVYIYFGSSNPISSIEAINADIRIIGNNRYFRFGRCISLAGDFNKDGISDLVISEVGLSQVSAGNTYIFFGSIHPQSLMDTYDANIKIIRTHSYDNTCSIVSSAGDFNNDRYDDIIIGSPEYFDGKAYIFYGKSNFNSPISIINADVTLYDSNPGTRFGDAVGGGE